jgi:hypothetical protein
MSAEHLVRQALKAQYRAGLSMLRSAIESLSDVEWVSRADRNPTWQMAYHALFYTHMYLQPSLSRFKAPEWHHREYASLGSPGDIEPASREQVLAYCSFCEEGVEGWVDALDLSAETCGFWWYKMGKLEHQLVNLRHLQHHAAQLADRLRIRQEVGTDWVASA